MVAVIGIEIGIEFWGNRPWPTHIELAVQEDGMPQAWDRRY